MANEIIELTTEAQVQKAIGLMLDGKTKKSACQDAGLSTYTFDRFIAESPEMVFRLQAQIRSQFANYIDEIGENRRKNLESILAFSARLREQLESQDMEEAIKAFQALVKLEGQLAKSVDMILPPTKEVAASGPAKMGDDVAQKFLQLLGEGATEIKVTSKIEVNQPDVIEGTSVPQDQT